MSRYLGISLIDILGYPGVPYIDIYILVYPEMEFKEFERRLKFKPRVKYGWFLLKLYQMFQDLSRRLN